MKEQLEGYNDLLKDEIKAKGDEIKKKDQQIEEKDKQIASLNASIENKLAMRILEEKERLKQERAGLETEIVALKKNSEVIQTRSTSANEGLIAIKKIQITPNPVLLSYLNDESKEEFLKITSRINQKILDYLVDS